MPKTATLQTNFTGGELSPALLGRVDVEKYRNGAARMENWHATVQGGAVTRPGSRYLGQALGDGRLMPFVYARGTAYVLELTATKLRIWNIAGALIESGGGPLVIDTPYAYDDVVLLNYEQAEDTMFLFHTGHMPRRLQRLSETNWRLDAAPFVTPPFSEQGFRGAAALTLSAATVGTGRTATAASPSFLPSDVGRELTAGEGAATVASYTDSTHVTLDVTSAFAATALPSWTLGSSPQGFLSASAKDPIGSTVTLTGAVTRAATLTLSAKTGAIDVIASTAVFSSADTGKTLYADAGAVELTYVSTTKCTGTTTTDFLRTVYQPGAWGITGDVFRTTDAGAFVSLNGGLFQIQTVTSASAAEAEIRVSPTALVAAPPGAWKISQPTFGAAGGYPRAGALWEQRLWLAGSTAEPQGVWASRVGEYLDFEPGLQDADGFAYKLNSHQRNPIIHLTYSKRLFALTSGLEVSLRGGNEKAIGPTNIQKENESNFGCSAVRPVAVGRELLFVQGAGKKVRAIGYSAASDGYDSPDRTVFSEHITGSGVVDMAFQAEGALLYAVRGDGQIAVAAYEIAQEVIAWSRYVTDGAYRSIAVLPNTTADDVWVLVNRPTAAGAPRYFVERFDETLATDCAGFRDTSGAPADFIDGLARFEGEELAVRADGAYLGRLPVIGGRVTLPRLASSYIEAGLPYLPVLELLPPDLTGGGSTTQGSNVSVHEVVVRVLDTPALAINGVPQDFRRFGSGLLDQPPPPHTGDYRDIRLTDDLYRSPLVITQPFPMRAHVLSVVRKVTVNDA